MRPDCSWSMSTAGLTAQEICLPSQSLFLRGSHCHSMAGAKSSWKYEHDFDKLYLSLDTAVNYSLPSQQQVPLFLGGGKQRLHSHCPHSPGAQPLPLKKSRPTQLSLSCTSDPYTTSPNEGDQVVPGFQRLSVSDRISPPQTPSRVAKPLPPIPGSVELSADQTVDSEVESFTGDDSCCLVPDQVPKSPLRGGLNSRRSFKGCGQINYAYIGPVSQQNKQQQQQQQQHLKKKQEQEAQEHLLQHQKEREQQQKAVCLRQQDRAQRKLRRSHSGPAGSFNKPSALRLSCHQRNAHCPDKPEIPPRVPIPPCQAKATSDYRRWSAEGSPGAYNDEDRPPKIPPREPLSSGTSRTPSPKSLPIYLNGIMPPTQSFAPDPKYVSRGLQRQNSEGSPCILPIMENGRKASTTHYFLLPQRPAYLDKHEKYFTDNAASRGTEVSGSSLDWACQSKRKMHSDFV